MAALRAPLALLVCLAVFPCRAWSSQDAPVPLTADQAVEQALANNARLRVMAAEALAARERAEAAGRPDPIRLSLNPATILEQVGATISQVLGISSKRKYASRAARHELAALLAGHEEYRLELVAATRFAYWELDVAQRLVEALEEDLADADELARSAASLADAGAVPRDEVVVEQAERADASDALITARGAERAARAQLALLLGAPATTLLVATDDPTPEPVLLPPTVDLVNEALSRRPALAEVAALEAAARDGVGLARAERDPEVGVGLAFEDLRLFGAASIDLPAIDFGSIRHSVAASRASAEAAAAEAEVVRQEIEAEVTLSVAALEQALARVEVLERERLPRRRTLLEAAERRYAAGAETGRTVVVARREYNAARRERLDACLGVLAATAGLERAIGGPWASIASGQPQEGTPTP